MIKVSKNEAKSGPSSIDELLQDAHSSLVPILCKTSASLMKLTLRAVAEMKLASGRELVPSPEFVERYLATAGGSTAYKTVTQKVGSLAKLCDFALLKGFALPTKFDARPISVPASFDENREEFTSAGRSRQRHTLDAGPTPSLEEGLRLIRQLRETSGPWPGGRLYMLAATVMQAEVSFTEAMSLDQAAVDLSEQKLRIVARWQRRVNRDRANININDHLAAHLERWLDRIGPNSTLCPFLFPNNTRSGPWEYYGPRGMGAGPRNALGEACKLAGTPIFGFKGLLEFGMAHRDLLSDLADSPFRIEAGDSILERSGITIAELAEIEKKAYEGSSKDSRWWIGRIFDILLEMRISSVRDLTPGTVDLFQASSGEPYPPRGKHMIYLHKICNDAIKLGGIDIDPFLNRPGFNFRKVRPLPLTTPPSFNELPSSGRRRLMRTDIERLLVVDAEDGQAEDGPAQWVGTAQELAAELDSIEGDKTRKVVATSIRLGRLTGVELAQKSKCGDAVNLLKRYAKSDPPTRLKMAFRTAGQGKRGYWMDVKIISNSQLSKP